MIKNLIFKQRKIQIEEKHKNEMLGKRKNKNRHAKKEINYG
jgi:hypothetical protein